MKVKCEPLITLIHVMGCDWVLVVEGVAVVDGGGRWWMGRLAGCLVGCPAVGEGGWEGVDDAGGLDGGVGDAFDH